MTARRREILNGYLLILPLCLMLIALTFYPFFYALFVSLRSWNLTNPTGNRFVGLSNYWTLLMDKRFWNALQNTAIYTISAVGLEFLLGFLVAFLLNRGFRGRNIVRMLFILPMLATPAPIAMVWRQIYDPTLGLANYFLRLVGIAPLHWTSDSSTALFSVILVDVWQWTPFFILTLSAGLAALPHEPVESAKIDGASTLQIIWHIILPMLKSLISITLVFRIMDTIKVYDLIYVLTEGGPGVSTETLNYYTYLTSFRWLRMGHGSALAIIMLLLTLSIGRIVVNIGSREG